MTPSEAADAMNTARINAKFGNPIVVPNEIRTTMGFGTGPQGEPDFGVANMVGQGRTGGWRLDPEETEWGILNLRDQGDWHDATIKSLAFHGNGNGKPIIDFSGYSMRLQDIFVRGSWLERFGSGTGLRIKGGQHYILDNVQCELIRGVGIHLDNVIQAEVRGCNGESCDVGLLLTHKGRRNAQIVVDNLYAEGSKVGIRSEGVTFSLRGGVFCSRDAVAVDLRGCTGCTINAAQSRGRVLLDAGCTGNEVIVGSHDGVTVEDSGQANTVRTVATPAVFTGATDLPVWVTDGEDGTLHRHVEIVDVGAADDTVEVQYAYRTGAFCLLMAQFYDLTHKEQYDPLTQRWGEASNVFPLPYITGQACTQRVRVSVGGKSRRIQARFLTRGAGARVELFGVTRV